MCTDIRRLCVTSHSRVNRMYAPKFADWPHSDVVCAISSAADAALLETGTMTPSGAVIPEDSRLRTKVCRIIQTFGRAQRSATPVTGRIVHYERFSIAVAIEYVLLVPFEWYRCGDGDGDGVGRGDDERIVCERPAVGFQCESQTINFPRMVVSSVSLVVVVVNRSVCDRFRVCTHSKLCSTLMPLTHRPHRIQLNTL